MEIVDLLKELKNNNPEIKNIEKLNVGFTNEVYSIDDEYILKICGNSSNEKRFFTEIDFYLRNPTNKYIPKLYSYHKTISKEDLSYLIIEKLSGTSLYSVWHTFSDEKRKQIIFYIVEMMKSFHSIKSKNFDWASYISNRIKNNLDICHSKRIIDEETYEKGLKISGESSKYLDTSEFALVHSDIHFDNIIYTSDEEIKIIDFETSLSAPIDYELDIFLRMCNNPFKYASEETEKYVKTEDYQNIEKWMKKFYPKIFSHKYYEMRMMYYNLEANIRLLPRFSDNEELKQLIIETVDKIEEELS